MAHIAFYAGGEVIGTQGRHGLESITVRDKTGQRRIDADFLAVSGGWNPTLHLTCHMNGRPVWNPEIAAFVPVEGAVPGLTACGAAAGVFSTAGCLADGAAAATRALSALGRDVTKLQAPKAEDGHYTISPLWVVEAKGRAWLDFANDVTAKDVRSPHRKTLPRSSI